VSPTRLFAVARKEALQLRRDPRSLLLAFALPVLLLVLFGYAISWDVSEIRLVVADGDRSAASRALVDAFLSSGYFRLVRRLPRPAEIAPLLERGEAQLVLVVPPELAADLAAGRPATLQAIVDGSDANTATIALAYAEAIVRTWASRAGAGGARLAAVDSRPRPPIEAESRVWFNEELASRNMIVPGLVAVVMMIIAAMLTSLTIAREWERGTMEQLASTPVTRAEVVFGKLLPYVGIGLLDVVVSTLLGVVLFGVPFRGSPLLLLALSFFFMVGALGLGMFISAVARSQVLATQIAMVATFLPAFLLSGFMFSLDVMPAALRAISYLIPARYFLVVTRGIFLKGVGLEVLRTQGLLMVAFAAVGLGLAVARFRKELA
jgi:ABC-2 type transport system permease protein